MRALMLLALVACAASALLFLSPRWRGVRVAKAATPSSGTLGTTGPVTPPDGKWKGSASGGSTATSDPLDGENGCQEGSSCDTFTLTVLPGVYTGKNVRIDLSWTSPTNDYDLVVYKGGACPATGKCSGTFITSSGNGATNGILTSEQAQFDPTSTGAGTYFVRIVYYNAPSASSQADPPNGVFSLVNVPVARTANYISGGISFSPNVTVKAPVAARDGEPSNRTDVQGNFYAVGIRGFPAGVDLWYCDLRPTVGSAANPNFDAYMRNWVYRGQPDAFSPTNVTDLGGDGGGDVDLAVSRPDPTTGNVQDPPTLAASSLIAANISTQRSTDRGQTFTKNNLGNCTGGLCGDDRQWEEFLGNNTVYLFYRTLAPAVSQIQRSDDGGLTFGPATSAGAIGQAGYIDVHQKTGTVYISGSSGQVCHGDPPAPGLAPLTYTCVQAATGEVAHLFFVVKVADDGTPNGTVYVAYSDDHDIYLRHSTDKGVTWSAPVRVSNGAETKTSVFPWIETGPTPGSVGVVWYGTTAAANDDSANWNVFYAQSFNATADSPTFRQAKISDHFIHGSNISEGGTLGNANRNLLDYFQVSFDPTGAAVVAYTDDHNDFDGHTYITRQIAGPRITGEGKTNVPDPGPTPAAQAGPYPLATDPAINDPGAQVTDFPQDVSESAVRVNAPDPLDILSIRYSCETGAGGEPVIVARMKVSNLSTVPSGSNWRMSFTANAPFAGVSPTGDYSFAVSDRGDQFYFQANTDNPASPTFTWGTAARNSDGSITYTPVGTADCGTFDTANGYITIKVSTTQLNKVATLKSAIGPGSVLSGLRGAAFVTVSTPAASASARRDITRGGTEFTVGNCAAGPTSGCAAAATPTPTPTPTATPTPPPPSTSLFQFELTEYPAAEDCTFITVGVTRAGDAAAVNSRATVDIASSNGSATQRGDFTFVVGRLVFEAGETRKTFQVLINEDAYTEGAELATLALQNPQNGQLNPARSTATLRIVDDASEPSSNPIDDSRTFVCTHYHDFLYRQSDQSGEDFWTQNIESCGANAQCRIEHRQDVSTAFFLSIEFQQTGYFVIRAHKAAFGSAKSTPRYAVFLRDQRQISNGVIVGQPGFQAQLDANKQAYLEDFVSRPEFVAQFPIGMTSEAYVDKLFANSGVTPTNAERDAATAAYNTGDTAGRANALKSVADSDDVFRVQYNPSFVLMQYFGYLRRNPDDAPDLSFNGYDFWLNKMNSFSQPGENVRDETVALARVRRAEMVRAFIESIEYRGRFAGSSDMGNQQGTGPDQRAHVGGAWAQELARAAPTLFDPRLLRFIWPS